MHEEMSKKARAAINARLILLQHVRTLERPGCAKLAGEWEGLWEVRATADNVQ
jgi:hypothetical protein